MSDEKITVGAVAVGAWRDGFAALNAQRGVALTTFLALALINLLPQLLIPEAQLAGLKPGVDPKSAAALSSLVQTGSIGLVSALVTSLALTPLAIAIHRFILLGETTSSYRVELGKSRFRRFALYTFLLNLIALTPAIFGILFLVAVRWVPAVAAALLGLGIAVVSFAAAIVLIVLLVRLTLLFPAVAVDAPLAGWNRALDQSKGHFWQILGALLLTSFLGILVFIAAALVQAIGWFLMRHGHLASGTLVFGVVRAAVNVLAATVAVAAASLLYRDLETRRTAPQA